MMHPPYPHHHTHHHYRPPSTPPTPRLSLGDSSEEDSISSSSSRSSSRHGAGARKRRSNSLPSISRTHIKSPFRDLNALPHSIEHHTNRIQKLKEGDGEWAPYSLNAVTPSSLPYHARPHYLPRFSTGSIPLAALAIPQLPVLPAAQAQVQANETKSCSPLHHPHHSTRYPSLSHTPPRSIAIPSTPPMTTAGIHHRKMSESVHSPLSTSEPMTPSSISSHYTNTNLNDHAQMPIPIKDYGISSARRDVISIPSSTATTMELDSTMDLDM
ncbi:hypothetical protein I302_104802 [Kwoniella bestiolae CBS 10118]|uniref:Uncharacterized protein n=1 Tax=Kwoniella bestiolae CBS 10118 TaxID=1296100 RepID=A0A1B9FRQ5_9TREE|nr:hypothetical protein I302_09129 [Kwoniella bestiolae CBS 10118]OCF21450.1 hypothetical protein I302_09129 [Kwoniella bestiolae CBS 10118]